MLRTGSIAIALFLASAVALAQGDARQAQIDAAINQAVASLRLQIDRLPLTEQVSVGDLIEATGGQATLTDTLRRSEMMGGPRWVSPTVCQVRLEIAGPRVARALRTMAAANPKACPVDQAVLDSRLAQWQNRTFVSDGTTPGPDASQPAPPTTFPAPTSRPAVVLQEPPPWVDRQLRAAGHSAPQSSPLKTLRAAQADARAGLRQQVGQLPLSSTLRLSEAALHDPTLQRAMERGLDQAQMDSARYDEDGTVRVRMTLELWRLWRELTNSQGE